MRPTAMLKLQKIFILAGLFINNCFWCDFMWMTGQTVEKYLFFRYSVICGQGIKHPDNDLKNLNPTACMPNPRLVKVTGLWTREQSVETGIKLV